MSSRARWTHGVPDYRNDTAKVATMLTIEALSAQTGLSVTTLEDRLTRDPITVESNPLSALCRPRGRIHTVPLWEQSQLDRYRELLAKAESEERKARVRELPAYTAEQAELLGMVTNREFSEMIGVHDQTLRRWARSDETYPQVVGTLSRPNQPGNPEHLYYLIEYVKWAREERGWQIPASVEHRTKKLRRIRKRAEKRMVDAEHVDDTEFARKALLAEQGA